MEVFEGTVRVSGDPFELSAVLLVADGKLRVTSREHELGTWALEEVSARIRPDGCHVEVEGEEMIVRVPHPVRLADAIGVGWTDPQEDSIGEIEQEAPPATAQPTVRRRLMRDLPLGWKIGAGLGLAVIGLWVFLPTILVGLVVLAGAALLLAGTMAALDPFTAVRLPERLTAGRLLTAGTATVALGLALAVVIA